MSGKQEFKCQFCAKEYKSKKSLVSHEKRHTLDEGQVTTGTVTASNDAGGRHYLHCDKCKKKYLTQKGLDAHHKTVHAVNDVSNTASSNASEGPSVQRPPSPTPTQADGVEGSENCEERLEDIPDEDEIFNFNIPESEKEPTYFFEDNDEAEEQLRNLHLAEATDNGQSSKSTDKNKKKKKQALISCPQCPDRKYQSIESYVKHRETHALSNLYKKAPSEETIWTKSKEVAPIVLKEMGGSKDTAGSASVVKETATKLYEEKQYTEEWERIIHCTISGLTSFFNSCDSYLTPSDLRAAYLKASTKFSVDTEARSELVKLLQSVVDVSQGVANFFFVCF